MQRALLDALDAFGGEGRGADLLLSDISPNRSGNSHLDEARMAEYADQSLDLAARCLNPGGSFVCKLLEGSEMQGIDRARQAIVQDEWRIGQAKGVEAEE